MDERLENAYNYSNYRLTLDSEIRMAKLKFKEDTIYSIHGGAFNVTPELINFVSNLLQMEFEEAIILDSKENPILVTDLKAFKLNITETYFAALNDYYTTMTELRKKRNVKSLIEGQ